ncbi:MAG: YtxH domain-containing protein [Elusimicrobiota bacterium]
MNFKNLVYLLLGTTTGAVIGILFAPKTGKETREELTNWLEDKREKGSVAVEEFRKNLPEHKERILEASRKVFKRNEHVTAEKVEA